MTSPSAPRGRRRIRRGQRGRSGVRRSETGRKRSRSERAGRVGRTERGREVELSSTGPSKTGRRELLGGSGRTLVAWSGRRGPRRLYSKALVSFTPTPGSTPAHLRRQLGTAPCSPPPCLVAHDPDGKSWPVRCCISFGVLPLEEENAPPLGLQGSNVSLRSRPRETGELTSLPDVLRSAIRAETKPVVAGYHSGRWTAEARARK